MSKYIPLIKKGFESVNLKFNKKNNNYIKYLESVEDFKNFSNFLKNDDDDTYECSDVILLGDVCKHEKIKYEYKYNNDIQKTLHKQGFPLGDKLKGELLIEENYYEKNIYYFYEFIWTLIETGLFHLSYKKMNNSLGFQLNLIPFDENTEKLKESSILFFNINLNIKTQPKIGYLKVSFLGKMEEIFNYISKENKLPVQFHNLNSYYKDMLKNITNEHVIRVDYFHDFYSNLHLKDLKDKFSIYGYKIPSPTDPSGNIIKDTIYITNSATFYYVSNKVTNHYEAKKNKNLLCRLYNKFDDNKKKGKSFLYGYNDIKLRRFEIETQTQFHVKFKERQQISKELSSYDYIKLVYKTIMSMKEENNKTDAGYKFKLPFKYNRDKNIVWKKNKVETEEYDHLKSLKFLKKGIKMIHDDEINEKDIDYLIELLKSKKDKNKIKTSIKDNNKKIKELKEKQKLYKYSIMNNKESKIFQIKNQIFNLFLTKKTKNNLILYKNLLDKYNTFGA